MQVRRDFQLCAWLWARGGGAPEYLLSWSRGARPAGAKNKTGGDAAGRRSLARYKSLLVNHHIARYWAGGSVNSAPVLISYRPVAMAVWRPISQVRLGMAGFPVLHPGSISCCCSGRLQIRERRCRRIARAAGALARVRALELRLLCLASSRPPTMLLVARWAYVDGLASYGASCAAGTRAARWRAYQFVALFSNATVGASLLLVFGRQLIMGRIRWCRRAWRRSRPGARNCSCTCDRAIVADGVQVGVHCGA